MEKVAVDFLPRRNLIVVRIPRSCSSFVWMFTLDIIGDYSETLYAHCMMDAIHTFSVRIACPDECIYTLVVPGFLGPILALASPPPLHPSPRPPPQPRHPGRRRGHPADDGRPAVPRGAQGPRHRAALHRAGRVRNDGQGVRGGVLRGASNAALGIAAMEPPVRTVFMSSLQRNCFM